MFYQLYATIMFEMVYECVLLRSAYSIRKTFHRLKSERKICTTQRIHFSNANPAETGMISPWLLAGKRALLHVFAYNTACQNWPWLNCAHTHNHTVPVSLPFSLSSLPETHTGPTSPTPVHTILHFLSTNTQTTPTCNVEEWHIGVYCSVVIQRRSNAPDV